MNAMTECDPHVAYTDWSGKIGFCLGSEMPGGVVPIIIGEAEHMDAVRRRARREDGSYFVPGMPVDNRIDGHWAIVSLLGVVGGDPPDEDQNIHYCGLCEHWESDVELSLEETVKFRDDPRGAYLCQRSRSGRPPRAHQRHPRQD